MCKLVIPPALVVAMVFITPLQAQYQIGPVYPSRGQPNSVYTTTPSGYDPFQLNWSTGRFLYVPIPYEPEQAGPNYDPYRFNWHTARWDYVPYPAPPAPVFGQRQTAPTTVLPERFTIIPHPARAPSRQPAGARPIPKGEPLPPLPPPMLQPQPQTRPTQSAQPPTTRPARPRPASAPQDPLHLDPTLGRWEYDRNTGRWIHILPSD